MTASRNPLLLGLVVLQTATLCLLMLMLFSNPPARGGAPAAEVSRQSPDGAPSLSVEELKTELRAIVRAEMAALGAAMGAGSPEPESNGESALSMRELQLQAQSAATSAAIIQQAVSAGVWTRADTEALMPQLGNISPEQRLDLVEEFYAAINRQELTLRDFPPL